MYYDIIGNACPWTSMTSNGNDLRWSYQCRIVIFYSVHRVFYISSQQVLTPTTCILPVLLIGTFTQVRYNEITKRFSFYSFTHYLTVTLCQGLSKKDQVDDLSKDILFSALICQGTMIWFLYTTKVLIHSNGIFDLTNNRCEVRMLFIPILLISNADN